MKDKKAYWKEYNNSERGKARYKKWEQSERGKAYRRKQYERQRSLLMLYASLRGCLDCRENDPAVLGFLYKNPKEKKLDLSQVNGCQSWPAILEEMAKCDVICTNCKRKRAWKENGINLSGLILGNQHLGRSNI